MCQIQISQYKTLRKRRFSSFAVAFALRFRRSITAPTFQLGAGSAATENSDSGTWRVSCWRRGRCRYDGRLRFKYSNAARGKVSPPPMNDPYARLTVRPMDRANRGVPIGFPRVLSRSGRAKPNQFLVGKDAFDARVSQPAAPDHVPTNGRPADRNKFALHQLQLRACQHLPFFVGVDKALLRHPHHHAMPHGSSYLSIIASRRYSSASPPTSKHART
mmetsp:Transcript_30916/g.65826  ORF Transcript_30916/g.65826 Transcript_30916/m.65826 type:complete len:218 (-) Transcript_30916:65-718(-)